ncbi:MAG TPA: energy transducer TonB [Terriglobales bacterium]|nr:energy transducer TonB [Terriglobales bacterium]
MKRWIRLIVWLALFSSWPLCAQESDQPLDTSTSPDSSTQRVPNISGFEVLTKATPRELRNYPFRILAAVRNKWFPQLRELEKSAALKTGATVIEFEINRDGSLGDMRTIDSTGDAALDAAASQAISKAAPFPALPETFPGQKLRLRYHLGYDQPASAEAPMCNGPNLGAHPADYVVRKVGNGVMPPHATNSNDPEYSDAARRMKYQSRVRIAGTVDPQGAFTDLCVLVPAGNGLDENAISAVKTWRFEPATFNGEPVAVRINVEADFRLY